MIVYITVSENSQRIHSHLNFEHEIIPFGSQRIPIQITLWSFTIPLFRQQVHE